ncbi:hypothetical protein M0Q28_06125 [Patescibacteria group bacterium]|jgi:hypothetical protein|nr:hypothetical protein [Patescibacteria group bacterium]
MSHYTGRGAILGGLPVIAEVSWGTDYWGEGYAEIEQIYWMKRDGTKGKPISQKIFDRAEIYDSYFSCLVEQLSEQAAHEADGEAEPLDLVTLE